MSLQKYINLDNSNIASRTRAYFRFRGKDVNIMRDGDRSVLNVEKSIKGAIAFILNRYERKAQDNGQKQDNNTTPIAPQDQDEYIPQDMEDKEDPNKPPSFWQISPPLSGYYYSGRKSYYDVPTKLWSKHKVLSSYTPDSYDTRKSKHVFSGKVHKGVFSLPLPIGCKIDESSVSPKSPHAYIQEDQKGCFYVMSTGNHVIIFDFYTGQETDEKPPITADTEKIITGTLTDATTKLLEALKASGKSIQEKADEVCAHINLLKKYSVEYQFYIYNTSKSHDYFLNLDTSPVLECYSANTLYVGLMRELGVAARLCTGHMIDARSEYQGQSHISNQTGHAWSEIWDEHKWVLMDATPLQKDTRLVEDLKEEMMREVEAKKNEMDDMGFDSDGEKELYDIYKELEEEVKPLIARNIRDLENILPREYYLQEIGYFRSGKLDKRKLVQWKISGDSQIFTRNTEEAQNPELLLFEGIVIDKSGSMGSISTPESPIREAIKSAIIRAKTLEHFDVHFSIIVFDTEPTEVMSFGEKFTSKKNTIPSRIMRAVSIPGGTDIGKPLELLEERIRSYETKDGRGRYGNITFIGDGEPTDGKTGKALQSLIERINKKTPITAYYISGGGQSSNALATYFGTENTELISDIADLPGAMMRTFNRKLRKKLSQLTN